MIRITLVRSRFKCVLKKIPEKIDSGLLRININKKKKRLMEKKLPSPIHYITSVNINTFSRLQGYHM